MRTRDVFELHFLMRPDTKIPNLKREHKLSNPVCRLLHTAQWWGRTGNAAPAIEMLKIAKYLWQHESYVYYGYGEVDPIDVRPWL